MFIAALFTVADFWNQSKCPKIKERILKNVIYMYNGMFAAIKDKVISFEIKWMKMKAIILSELSPFQ